MTHAQLVNLACVLLGFASGYVASRLREWSNTRASEREFAEMTQIWADPCKTCGHRRDEHCDPLVDPDVRSCIAGPGRCHCRGWVQS